MILIDMNQVAISHLMVRKKVENGINIDTIRKSILSVLAKIKKKYSEEYGELVVCYDDKDYWRRDVFQYYKQNRKKERQSSSHDWNQIFSVLNTLRDEIRNNFPFRVLQVHGAEADDIIATLCSYNMTTLGGGPVLILSADKDFIQLHKYPFVKQYDPIHSKWITTDNPRYYLQEQIVRGDRSDGIPNILSADDTFVSGKSQKMMSKQKIAELASLSPSDFTNHIRLRNWRRNNELINFERIPAPIRQRITTSYNKGKVRKAINIDYFTQHQLADIMGEF